MVMNANSRLHRDRLANCLLPCSSWQTASRYHPYLSSSHSQCCRMQLSRIAGVERHPSFKLWERRASRRSVAASDCLHLRGAASPLQAGEGMVSERCPVRARPSPCLILARARLPFRFAAMAASACIAYCQSSRQTAPAMPAASSDAAQSSAESAHAYASAFTDLHIAAIARWTDCRRRLQPQQYAVSKPISIAYARTCDAFLMSRLVWPAGICVACSICAAISQHTHLSVCRTTPHDLCLAHRQTRS